jgi:membrane protease YdiL (CAAX protease family)
MSAELAGQAPVEPRGRVSRLNRWVTAAALAVLAVLAALVFWPAHGLDTLDRPEESLERVVTRDMDFRAAAATAPVWERRLHALAFSSDAGARADAIAWYEELARLEGSPLAELYRIILLAEDGQTEAVESVAAAWAPADDTARELAAWARTAYEAQPPPPEEFRATIAAVRRELTPGWFADRLLIRLASRLGDAELVAERERAIRARGRPLLWRLRAILISESALVALGLAAVGAWLTRPGGRAARVAAAPIPPSWSAADGIGLFARGAVGLVAVAVVWPFLPDRAGSTLLVSVLQILPLGGYLLWHCGGSRRALADTFGLCVPRRAWATLAWATVALVGVSTLADVLIDLAGARLGVETHWTDGFQERLVWGTPGEVLADAIDSCVFAPVLEEPLFRGVLYATLRLRAATGPATLVSAAIFALAHGYGVVGFVSVFGSGVLWALAYERTRSLLPGMLAHAVSNVQATTIVLATLRF